MTKTKAVEFMFTQPVRAVFIDAITPRTFDKNSKTDKPKFGGTFVFPADSPDVANLKAAMMAAAKQKWPSRDLKELKFPLTTGAKKIETEKKMAAKKNAEPRSQAFFEGNTLVITARSDFEPGLAKLVNGKVIEISGPTRAACKDFYNGCYVIPVFAFVPYDAKKADDPDGVTAYLQSLLWVKDGERIGGGSVVSKFAAYAGTVTDQSPGSDDEISF